MKKHVWELKKKRFERWLKKLLFFRIFPLTFFLVSFLWIFNSNFLEIKEIVINFEKQHKDYLLKEKIKNKINYILDEKYYSIFSKRNFIFYPQDEIKSKILNSFPEVKNINFQQGEGGGDLILSIKLENSNFIVCKSEARKECYSLNKKGKITKKTEEKNDFIFIKKEIKPGELILKNYTELEKMLDLISFLEKRYKLKVKDLDLNNNFLYILTFSKKEKIIISSDFDSKKINIILGQIFKNGDLKIFQGKFINNISYINLSLKNRIAYCMKGDVCENNY